MSRRIATVAIAIVSIAGAGAFAFWIAATLDGEPASPPAVLPDFGPEELVVVPVPIAGEDPWEAGLVISSIDDDNRAAASEVGVVLGQGDGVTQPVSTGEPVSGESSGSPTTDPTAGFDDGSMEGEIPTHPPGDADSVDTHMSDTCAEDPPPETCPEGVAGTVLAIRSLPDLAGIGNFDPHAPGSAPYNFWPECPPTSSEVGTVQLGIATNRPAVTHIEYHPTSPHLLPPPPSDGRLAWDAFDPRLPTESFEVVTPDAAEAPWVSWVEDEAAGYDDPRYWIDHCSQLSGLAPGDYIARFTFTDKYDSTIVYTPSTAYSLVRFRVPDADGAVRVLRRRPVSLVGYGIDRLYVAATRKPDQVLQVAAFERDGTESCDTGGDATRLRSATEDRLDARVVADDEIPREVLAAPDYPYFRDHSRSVLTQLYLTEGTDYLVCIYWLVTGGPSFEPVEIIEAESSNVSTPEAYRPSVRLHGFVNLFGEIQGAFASVRNLDCGWRTLAFEGRFETERRIEPAAVLCERSTRLTDWNLNGIPMSTTVDQVVGSDPQRRSRVRVNLRCVTAPCPSRANEVVLVPLPDVPTQRRLCGSGWGSGCDDEIPMRSAGNALVEISFDATPGNGATSWSIGDAEGFTDTPAPTPDEPRIDASSVAEVVVDPATRTPTGAKLDVTVQADRPVSLAMEIISDADGGEPCVLGLRSTYLAATPSTSHTFTFHDLCLFESYRILVTGTDTEGDPVRLLDRETGAWTANTFVALTPALSLEMGGTITVTPPNDGYWHWVTMSTLSITPDLSETDAARRSLFPGSIEVDWLRVPGLRSEVGGGGWFVFSRALGGMSWACGVPTARPLTITNVDNGIRPGIYVPYVGSTTNDLALQVDLSRGGSPSAGAPAGACSAGAPIERVQSRGTVSLEDLFAGVELTSESGSVRLTLRATGWTPR